MLTDDDKWASLAAELGIAETAKGSGPAESADAPAKRGRGRGRRGGARKRVAEKETATEPLEPIMEDAVVMEDIPTMDDDGANKKRRRRRSRRKKGTGDAVVTSKDDTAVAVLDEDAADSPAENWKMPTWQELIDSLQRP